MKRFFAISERLLTGIRWEPEETLTPAALGIAFREQLSFGY
jgi:hypothetical protein